jgi:hypothetical protein
MLMLFSLLGARGRRRNAPTFTVGSTHDGKPADLAAIMTPSRVFAESRSEIAYAASFIEWFEEGKRAYTIPPSPWTSASSF